MKTLLNRKNRLFKNVKKHGYQNEDMIRLSNLRKECQETVETAKTNYLKNIGNKLHNPETCQKSYWKLINKVLNKTAAPKIPPLFRDNKFILNCKEKANIFNDFFCRQCKLIVNNSTLPKLTNYHTEKRLDQININIEDIASLLRKINPNKATGSDGISGHMLLLCYLQLIFTLHCQVS